MMKNLQRRAKNMTGDNIIFGKAPDFITVNGKKYPIRTDFRIWIRYALIISDESLTPSERASEVIEMCLVPPHLPENIGETLRALADFYSAGKAADGSAKRGERVFDFGEDEQLIYAAFMQQYGIDLTACDMHWHKFRALFTSLAKDTKFCEAVSVRSMDLNLVSDKKLREKWRRLKQLYALPDRRTAEQMENDIANMLWG